MTVWILIWKLALILALIAFSIMSLAVTIGGGRDVMRLLRELELERQKRG